MIPLFYPPKQDVELMIDELQETLSGRWWGQGPKVDRFEQKFGAMFGIQYPVMTNSCTAALHLAYILADIKPGDEVIVPVLTCTATCHPLKAMGAKIIFADIRPDTLTMDPVDVEEKITNKTKAIVTVDLGGVIANRANWLSLSIKYGVQIIEDAAQSLGAPSAGYGFITCFSFQAIKLMSTGDGGMVCPSTQEHYQRAKRLRWFDIDREKKAEVGWQAWDRRGITFDQEHVGYKYQPTDIDASIGLAALKSVGRSLEHRHSLARLYRSLLEPSPRVTLLNEKHDTADWLFMVLVNGDRDEFADKLMKAGVETNVAHIRNDLFSLFGGKRLDLPGMNSVEKRYICLPINDAVVEQDVEYICKVIND